MFPFSLCMFAIAVMPVRFLLPLLAVIDPVLGVAIGLGVVAAAALLVINRDKLGLGGGAGGLDALIATLTTSLQKVEATAMLSPLGRTAMCGIIIFIGKVVALFAPGAVRDACLAACKTLGDAFVDPPVADTPPPTAAKIS